MAQKIEILERRPDGSGRVRMPVLTEGVTIDLARTASRVNGKITITREMMLEMVHNGWPGPRPVHRSPHRQYEDTAGPGDGFIDNLEYKDGVLLGTFDLTAPLFAEVVGRQWRGFSADMFLNREHPTGDIKGWAMHGGVFTNRPATPIDAAIAASQNLHFEESATAFIDLADAPGKEIPMSDELTVRLATVEAEKKTLADQNASLETRLKEAKEDREKAEAALEESKRSLDVALGESTTAKALADRREREFAEASKENEKLRADKVALSSKVADLETASLKDNVVKVVRKAISTGVPPAMFDGFEKDPVAWLKGSYVSLENLQRVISGVPKIANLSATKSAGDNPADRDADVTMDPERVQNLKSLGLDPRLAGITSAAQLEELRDSGQLKK